MLQPKTIKSSAYLSYIKYYEKITSSWKWKWAQLINHFRHIDWYFTRYSVDIYWLYEWVNDWAKWQAICNIFGLTDKLSKKNVNLIMLEGFDWFLKAVYFLKSWIVAAYLWAVPKEDVRYSDLNFYASTWWLSYL